MTETVKHTPGPWRVVKTAHGPIDIVIPDGRDIVTVYGGGSGDKEGNARLIAAAPDLLAMLKVAQLWLDVDGRFDMQGVNAAIAKAEGRS